MSKPSFGRYIYVIFPPYFYVDSFAYNSYNMDSLYIITAQNGGFCMSGTAAGNCIALIFYCIFQAGGIFLAWKYFSKEQPAAKILIGSVAGSFCFMWLPIITSFIFGFTVTSHIVALVLFTLLFVLGFYLLHKYTVKSEATGAQTKKKLSGAELLKLHAPLLILLAAFIYFAVTLFGHTIPTNASGGMDAGQSTYGDMNLHLAFITSIAGQDKFPPDYSLLPGTRLSYPFLSDSISSSMYIWGCSLRFAYIFPMLVACLQLFTGFYLLAVRLLKDKAKAVLSWVFFFLNGGLGFWYFIDTLGGDKSKFTQIFTGFYTTPTNYTDGNLRWVNVIVDMLIPQRASLFGWALLFCILYLLVGAVKSKQRKDFIVVGVLAGGLPMIHTHSFLSLAMICLVWVTYELIGAADENWKEKTPVLEYCLLGGGILLLAYIQYRNMFVGEVDGKSLMFLGILGAVIAVCLCGYTLIQVFQTKKGKEIVWCWGLFLAVVLVLALPQLFIWTFKQSENSGYLRGHFNWSNASDLYIWFYIKNMGVVLIAALAAMFSGKRGLYFLAAPAMLIWYVAEFIAFQPNDYDNNKLIFVAYALLCFLAADLLVNVYRRMAKTPWKYISAVAVLVLCTASAFLTMGREYVSNYEVYNADQIQVSKYIDENASPNATIMTDMRHNNAIAALTGRNLVCGTSTFLYFHGLDYAKQEQDLTNMYLDPAGNQQLFSDYHVEYIVIGPEERASYEGLDESVFASLFECVYTSGDVNVYACGENIVDTES